MLAILLQAAAYVTEDVQGWTVRIEAPFAQDPKSEWPRVRTELANQLYRIARVVPDKPLADIRKVTIYVHRDSAGAPCMAYHPSAQWLTEHKLDPAMAKSVQIGNAKNFLSWTYEQPWMVMHELAHAYHHQFLDKGFENEKLAGAWKRVTESKRYDSILHWNGSNAKHYALNNPMEFFAETSESYFGRNDFYPFVRAELKTFDPESFQLMEEIWGQPQKR